MVVDISIVLVAGIVDGYRIPMDLMDPVVQRSAKRLLRCVLVRHQHKEAVNQAEAPVEQLLIMALVLESTVTVGRSSKAE